MILPRLASLVALAFLAACGGSSTPAPVCSSDAGTFVSRDVCIECGASGGCATRATQCARTCTSQPDCDADGLSCVDGVCQVGFCI